MTTLGEDLPIEIERCQELLAVYKEIGPPGQFALLSITEDIAEAHKAMMGQDLPAMIRAYKKLKGCK